MSDTFERLILNLLCGSSAEVQPTIYWNIFDCAKVELLQVYFKYTVYILHLKTDIIKTLYNTH